MLIHAADANARWHSASYFDKTPPHVGDSGLRTSMGCKESACREASLRSRVLLRRSPAKNAMTFTSCMRRVSPAKARLFRSCLDSCHPGCGISLRALRISLRPTRVLGSAATLDDAVLPMKWAVPSFCRNTLADMNCGLHRSALRLSGCSLPPEHLTLLVTRTDAVECLHAHYLGSCLTYRVLRGVPHHAHFPALGPIVWRELPAQSLATYEMDPFPAAESEPVGRPGYNRMVRPIFAPKGWAFTRTLRHSRINA